MIRPILGFRILQKILKTVLVVPNGGRAPQDAQEPQETLVTPLSL